MRRLAILTVLMLALLPLRWFKAVSTPAGVFYVHEVGFLLLTVWALMVVDWRAFLRARDCTLAFTAPMAAGFLVWAAACIYAGVTLSSTVKEVAFLIGFVVVTGLLVGFAESADPRPMRILRWAGVVTTVVLLLALGVALAINSINPLQVIGSAISSGDPSLIEAHLYRPAFAGFGYSDANTVSQLRHEVFAGLLVSLLVASWAQHREPFQRGAARVAYRLSVLGACLLILVSLSRSVQLAAICWPLIAGLRLALRGRITRRAVTSMVIVAVAVVLLAVTGVLGVVLRRITSDSSSYNARGAKLGDALDTIGQHPWVGGQYDDSISSHNFVLDAWLRGGVVMAVLMLAALLAVVGRLLRDLALLAAAPTEMVAGTAALMLPLVRMFTIGAGLLTPPEWVALAFAFAAAIVHERERRGLATPGRPASLRGIGPTVHPVAR